MSQKFFQSRLIWLVLAVLLLVGAAAAVAQEKPKSLYARLGGYDAIALVVDDFFGRMMKDLQLSRFFTGHATDSVKRIRQLTVDKLCADTGGPCYYTGRNMKLVHTGLGITESDWDLSVKHLVATLDKFKVPAREKSEVLSYISGMKADIVEKKK